MKRFFFSVILSILLVIVANAQIIKDKTIEDEDKVFEKVPIEAGTNEKAWADHIKRKTQLPDSVMQNIPVGTYRVSVQFIIDKHGSIGQIKALNDPGYGLAQRAEHAVSSYKGEWKPAIQCGREVKAYRKQVIVFVIPNTRPNL
jgi:periplasmic protein TonB